MPELPEVETIRLALEPHVVGRRFEHVEIHDRRLVRPFEPTAVATSLDIPVAGGRVHVEGDLDFRGTLAVAKEAPIGFMEVRVRFDLDSAATPEQLDTLLRLTERYCVVYQTLARSPRLSAKWETAS